MSIKKSTYNSSLYLKKDNDFINKLYGYASEYLTKYEKNNYKFFITDNTIETEGIFLLSIAKLQSNGKFKLLTIEEAQLDYLNFMPLMVDFIKKYMMDNPLLEYFFLWLPPITKENTSDIFLDISDIFYIEFQVNIWGGINCNYTNYRGEQFYNSIYSNQNNDTVFINKRLEYAYQTKQNNYISNNVCNKFFSDNELYNTTNILTLKNDSITKKYNDKSYCHIYTLIKDKPDEAIEMLTILFENFFKRLNDDFSIINPLNSSNYAIMLYERGGQVPIVHFKIRHADEYLKFRGDTYHIIKDNVGKLRSILTESGFTGGAKKCPTEGFTYDLLFRQYDLTPSDDDQYEYVMKLKKLLKMLQNYGLEISDATHILYNASNYQIDIFTIRKVLNIEKEKEIDIMKMCEEVFPPKIPYNIDYKFYLILKKRIIKSNLKNIFIKIKNMLRVNKINMDSFYFIKEKFTDDEKQFIIKEGNELYHTINYKKNINTKFEYTYEIQDIKTAKDVFLKPGDDTIELYTQADMYFNVFDANNDNMLSADEFLKFATNVKNKIDEINKKITPTFKIDSRINEFMKEFKNFDTNDDYLLNKTEFYNFLKNGYFKTDTTLTPHYNDYKRNIRHFEFTNVFKKINIGRNPLNNTDAVRLYFFYLWIKKLILINNIRYYININKPTNPVDIEKVIFEETANDLLDKDKYKYLNLGTSDYHIHSPEHIKMFIELLSDDTKKGSVIMHCGAGDGRSGFFLFSLLVFKNLTDSYHTLLQKFLCSYRFYSFREVFGETDRLKLLVGRLLSLYAAITKLLDKDNTYKNRPKFLEISKTYEPKFIDYIKNKALFNDDPNMWNPGIEIDKIFTEKSYKNIVEYCYWIHTNRENESYFFNNKNWEDFNSISILRNNYSIFRSYDNVNENENFNVIEKNIKDINISTINSLDSQDPTWEFKKSLNNILTEFLLNNIDRNLLLELLRRVYNNLNDNINEYKKEYNILDNDLFVYLKGGFLFYLINKNHIKNQPFTKSDIDFEIYLNPSINNYNVHYLNINKIAFNTLLEFKDITGKYSTNKDLIEKLMFSDFTESSIIKLYNKLNKHVLKYDKSKLEDIYKNINELLYVQISNYILYMSKDGKYDLYKLINDNLKLQKMNIKTDGIPLDIYNKVEKSVVQYTYFNKNKFLQNIYPNNYYDNKTFIGETKENINYNNLTFNPDNSNQYTIYNKKIRNPIFTNNDYKYNGLKISYNSSHYYKTKNNDIKSFNLLRLVLPNYIVINTIDQVKQKDTKLPISLFSEIIDVTIPKKNDYLIKKFDTKYVSTYNVKLDDGSIFRFKGENIKGLIVKNSDLFRDSEYGKKEKRAYRFNELLTLYMKTLNKNKDYKLKIFYSMYRTLKTGIIIDTGDKVLDTVFKDFEYLYNNRATNEEMIKILLKSNKTAKFFDDTVTDESIYLNFDTYKKYLKYKIKYLNYKKQMNS